MKKNIGSLLVLWSIASLSQAQTLKKSRIIGPGSVVSTDAEAFTIGEDQRMFYMGGVYGHLQVSDLSGKLLSTSGKQLLSWHELQADLSGNVYTSGTNEIVKYDVSGNQIWKKYDSYIRDIVVYQEELYVLRQCQVQVRNLSDGAVVRTLQLTCATHPQVDSVMSFPVNFEIDPSGNLCINEGSNIKVYRWDNGAFVRKAISNFVCATFSIRNNGDYIMTQLNSDKIYIYDENGNFRKTFGNSGYLRGQFKNPYMVDTDAQGHIYVLNNGMVQHFDVEGNFISGFGKPGDAKHRFFNAPENLAVDHRGYLITSDYLYLPGSPFKNYLQVLDSVAELAGYIPLSEPFSAMRYNPYDSLLYTLSGGVFHVYNIAEGAYVDRIQLFIHGGGVAMDFEFIEKDVLVINTGSRMGENVIKKLEKKGFNQFVEVFSAGNGGSDNAYGDDMFSFPYAIASRPGGNIYVSDVAYENIQVYDRNGNFLFRDKYYDHGKEGFNGPVDMEFGPHGYLYVCDKGNNRIVVLDSSLNYVSVYAEKQAGPEDALLRPQKLLFSGDYLYVLDKGKNRIQQLYLDPADTSGRVFRKNMHLGAVSQQAVNFSMQAYPNPTSGLMVVNSAAPVEYLAVTDMSGANIIFLDAPGKSAQLDLSALAPGCYVVKALINKSFTYTKVIKY
jgi:DNA-binding beta-propeller fold protein YncE